MMKHLPLALVLLLPLNAIASHFDFRWKLPTPEPVSHEEGVYRIQSFRQYRYPGDISFHFQLTNNPKGGQEELYYGTLWGTWSTEGPVLRVEMWPANSKDSNEVIKVLVHNGPNGRMWKQENNGDVREVTPDELFKPLWQNMVYTPFDIQMGFIYWPEFDYYGPARTKGRQAHIFTMYPPKDVKTANPGIKGVHMAMDDQFNALLKADLLSTDNEKLRSFKIQSFRKVQDEYVIRTIDVVDNTDRSRSRMHLIAAAMHIKIDPQYFDPINLSKEGPQISQNQYSPIN